MPADEPILKDWAGLRLALGVAQGESVAAAGALIFEQGIKPVPLGAAVFIRVLATICVFLFGSRQV